VTAWKENGDESDTASITSESSVGTTNGTPPGSPTVRPGTSPPPKTGIISHFRSPSNSGLHKQATSHDFHVPREKNRLTLRSFLRQVIKDKKLGRSKALAHFLLHDPLPRLTREEEADIERRLDMDRLRLAEQKKFVEESSKRARELEHWLRGFKSDLVRNRVSFWDGLMIEGLTKLFEEIRVKESIKDLQPEYQKVAEWAKIEYSPVAGC
jgi:hypothetical protein